MTWRALGEQVDRCEDRLSALGHRRVALAFSPTWQAFAALFALDRLGCDVVLMSDQVTVEDAASLGGPLNLEALVAAADGADEPILVHHWPRTAAASGRRAVTILTSGTSGQPKPVRHTWQTLARAARSAPPQRWLLTYRPNLYAGLQVILQCLMNKGTLVLPSSGMSAHEVVALMAAAKVEYASATPSYWRWLVTMAESAAMQRVSAETDHARGRGRPAADSRSAEAAVSRCQDCARLRDHRTGTMLFGDGRAGRIPGEVSRAAVERRNRDEDCRRGTDRPLGQPHGRV